MAKHRILILSNRVPYPLNDGGSLAMHTMIEGYHKDGWDVFLFSMNTSRHYVPTESLPELYSEIGFETFDINTDVRFVPTLKNFFLSRKPNHAERFYDKAFADRLLKIILNFEPEIIQLESVYLATYLSFIREATDAKIAIRLHNLEFQIWERLAQETSSFRKYYLKDLATRIKKFEISAWHQADVLMAITDADAATVQSIVPDKKIITIPFGISIKDYVPVNGEEQWTGYHIGAMDWMPNAEAISWFLEEVWMDLKNTIPEFQFYFAGRNMPGAFEKYEGNGVVCAGEVSDARQFVADKKILIVPLRSGSGIRIKVLEAMAIGKLVVSTAVGMQGISGAVQGVHFLLAETKDDFIRQIKWALENRNEAADIAKNGCLLVQNEYDLDKIMTRLTETMEHILPPTF